MQARILTDGTASEAEMEYDVLMRVIQICNDPNDLQQVLALEVPVGHGLLWLLSFNSGAARIILFEPQIQPTLDVLTRTSPGKPPEIEERDDGYVLFADDGKGDEDCFFLVGNPETNIGLRVGAKDNGRVMPLLVYDSGINLIWRGRCKYLYRNEYTIARLLAISH